MKGFDYQKFSENVENLSRFKPKYFSKSRQIKDKNNKNIYKHFCIGLCIGFILSSIIRECLFKSNLCLHDYLHNGKETIPKNSANQDLPTSNQDRTSEKKLLYVGVMTANKYLDTRAKYLYETWGHDIPGKLEFFSSEFSRNTENIPLIKLKGVDDTYPPQKKSFLMMKYMFDHYIDKYEFFMRADDDIYIRTERIENFLKSINSSNIYYIGQAGKGTKEESGLLSLNYDENYCMGGPGMIFSRATLAKLAPHIKKCLKNLKTLHEDVEIGRCVKKFVGIPCTWSSEMRNIFHHNNRGMEAFSDALNQKEIHQAITLHPVKNSDYVQRLQNYFKGLTIRELEHGMIIALKEIHDVCLEHCQKLLSFDDVENGIFIDHLVSDASIQYWKPSNLSELIEWNFFKRNVYRVKDGNPKHKIDVSTKIAVDDVVRDIMESIDRLSKERGRKIEFDEILYGYYRHNPLYSSEFILDMLLVYKKYSGKKMTVPVRRHTYLQVPFGPLYVREYVKEASPTENYDENSFTAILKSAITKGVGILKNWNREEQNENHGIEKERITLILPLAGRISRFYHFIDNYENVCLKRDKNTRLMIVAFRQNNGEEDTSQTIANTVQRLLSLYTDAMISVIWSSETFSRALGLELGASECSVNDLMFFIDVDMKFSSETMDKIRLHTVKGKQVYYPIVYSEFDPKLIDGRRNLSEMEPTVINEETGYWRAFGYGMLSIYRSDLRAVGGFNTSIKGWGKEDIDFYERVIKYRKLKLFRAPDPSLVHNYHEVTCDAKLKPDQLKMCHGSQLKSLASLSSLVKILLKIPGAVH